MNLLKHIRVVLIHKWYVFWACCKAGIPLRGLLHDMSKFSIIELYESAKYFQGDSSPIDACKKDKGYSLAWNHHKGRNPHHYEYWVDYLDDGGKPAIMPYKYAIEMICDYIGAGKAYSKKSKKKYQFIDGLNWWNTKKSKRIAMHPAIIRFTDLMFEFLVLTGSKTLKKKVAYKLYTTAIEEYNNGLLNKPSIIPKPIDNTKVKNDTKVNETKKEEIIEDNGIIETVPISLLFKEW